MLNSKFKFALVFLLVFLSTTYFVLGTANAVSESDCLNKSVSELTQGEMDQCINEILPRIAAAYAPAQEKNKANLAGLKKQIDSLNSRINSLSTQLKNKELEIKNREKDVVFAQKVLNEKAVSQYIAARLYDPIISLISANDALEAFKTIKIKEMVADSDRQTIEKYSNEIVNLKNDKQSLEKNKISLAGLQKKVSLDAKFLEGEVGKVESFLSDISEKQKDLAAAKAGGFSTSIGDVPTSSEPCSGKSGSSNFCDPGFRPAFAGFSYGAPHRNGMSQYGAYGRAKSGQSAEQILKVYYGDGIDIKKDYPNETIVLGRYNSEGKLICDQGSVDLETYANRIYEMPGSWGDSGGMEALKAQVVAARSYGLSQVKSNGCICMTESCQVYKPANKGGKWAEAVSATRGWVLMSSGKPLFAKYASTSGGYILSYTSGGYTSPGFWDTPNNQGGWPNSSYEIVGGSPWFYKGWYKDRSGNSCKESNPWLTSEEMADILNAWKVLSQGGGDVSRVSPTSCGAPNSYSMSELKSIGGFESVSSVSVVYSSSGSTQSVSFGTNKGNINVSGEEFKKAFNLRAPGFIGIKSSLFNIEKL